MDSILKTQSPTEYFLGQLEAVMRNQHIVASTPTSFYIVNLLASFVHPDHSGQDEVLGVQFAKALQTTGIAKRDGLRRVGDLSLFISGFFADSLNPKLINVDYYIHLGEYAYSSLARSSNESLGEVFDELTEKFVRFVDVLSEISERASLTSNTDILRLYKKWLRTKSRRLADLLTTRGIVPNTSIHSKFIQ